MEPLSLAEKQRFRIQFDFEKQKDSIEFIENDFQSLIDTDCFTLSSGQSKVRPVSLKERNRVADILGQAAMKPVSEMIIEDRGEW